MLALKTIGLRSASAVVLLSTTFVWGAELKSPRGKGDQGRWSRREPNRRPPVRRPLMLRYRDGNGVDFRLTSMPGEDKPRFRQPDRRRRERGRGRDRPGEPGGFRTEEFAEDMERIQKFLAEHFPERLGELQSFRRGNPAGFQRRMGQMMPRLRRIMDMLKRNPEAGRLMIREERLEFQIHRSADRYFEVTEPDRLRELRDEIRRLVEEKFEVRLKLREQEIQRLERRLDAIRKQLDRDIEHRRQRIEQSLGELGIFDD